MVASSVGVKETREGRPSPSPSAADDEGTGGWAEEEEEAALTWTAVEALVAEVEVTGAITVEPLSPLALTHCREFATTYN